MKHAVLMLAALVVAGAASAQTSVAAPPGNTLAPQTGTVAAGPTSPAATGGDMAPAATPQLAAEKYKTEIVCKTTVETGSLIARHKTCLTRKQWQYVNDENERTAREFVEDNMGRPTSN